MSSLVMEREDRENNKRVKEKKQTNWLLNKYFEDMTFSIDET